MMKTSNKVINLGCRLNSYESGVMQGLADQANLQNTIIVNTCAVTAEAERQARQVIRKMHREHPDAKIVVTGCGAQIKPLDYSKIQGVTKVIGNEEKMHLSTYQNFNVTEDVIVNDIMKIKETAAHLVSGFEGKARAFIQIQNGCDHRCTFCTIPYGRGNSRSVAIGKIVDQIKFTLEQGVKEIVFTGVDITAYGADLPGQPTLGEMCKRVLTLVPELKRLRLSSLDPVEIDDMLWKLIGEEERLMPHLHLSLQAGDDMILKRMKRRHLRADAINFCRKAKSIRPNVLFGADLIAGFPTETESMFNNTLKIVDDCDLTYLHVFPYSARENTPAFRMPQVNKSIIKQRAKILRNKGSDNLTKKLNDQIGLELNVMIEELNEGVSKGKTDNFIPVIINSEYPVGTVIKSRIIKSYGHYLEGRA